jgi:hypothetical protein
MRIADAPQTRALNEGKRVESAAIAFARQYGLLGLCVHGLPGAHDKNCARRRPADSITGYHRFAVCLDALLRIGLELNCNRPGAEVDWELADSILRGPDFPTDLPGPHAPKHKLPFRLVSVGRKILGFQIDWLASICRVRPQFCWHKDAWAIEFDSEWGSESNVPAILAIQLMAEIGAKAMRKCRNCPRWFAPSGRQVYCDSCGIKAAWRDAKRRQRSGDHVDPTLAKHF